MLQPGERIDFQRYGVRRERTDVKVPGSLYCRLVRSLEDKCAQHSLLEIWRYREDLMVTTSTQAEWSTSKDLSVHGTQLSL